MVTAGGDGSVSFRAQVSRELEALQEDLLWTEKAHFSTAELYAKSHLSLGIMATGFAAVAAASVVADAAPVISGSAAVIAAIASGIVAFLTPQDSEHKHLAAGRRLGALRVRVRQALDLDLHPTQPEHFEAWRAMANTFAAEKAQIDSDAPGTSNRAFRAARGKIESGHFQHGASAQSKS